MIESLLKPVAYLTSADFAMRLSAWRMRIMSGMTAGRYILRKMYAPPVSNLDRMVFGMKFTSPVGMAAGYDRNGDMIDALDATGFGFVEIGSITPRPQGGSPHPYLFRMKEDRALLYRAAIESDGVEKVIGNLKRRRGSTVVGCSLAKNSSTPADEAPADYLRSFRSLYQYADYFTVNLCDNTTADRYVPTDKARIMAIVEPLFAFRRGQNQYRPILLKISPDLTDEQIDMATDIMLETPVDGIVACGGTTGRYGLGNSSRTMHTLGRTPGALCGRPLRERALQVVRRIHERSKGTYPIIGCGGVSTPDDVLAMLDAGATLVQICTEFVYGGGKSLRNIRMGLDERIRKAEQRKAVEEARARRQEQDTQKTQPQDMPADSTEPDAQAENTTQEQ